SLRGARLDRHVQRLFRLRGGGRLCTAQGAAGPGGAPAPALRAVRRGGSAGRAAQGQGAPPHRTRVRARLRGRDDRLVRWDRAVPPAGGIRRAGCQAGSGHRAGPAARSARHFRPRGPGRLRGRSAGRRREAPGGGGGRRAGATQVSDLDPLGGLPQDADGAPADRRSAEVRAAEERHRPPAPTTVALLAVIGILFLAEIWLGRGLDPDPVALFRLGSLSAAAVRDGDWWRLGSYAFLHGGPLHLLFNAYALWILMRPIEGLFGPAVALGLFAATAIAGGEASIFASTLRHSPWQQAVGASGGIFGLFGAHVALYWRLRHRLAPEARGVERGHELSLGGRTWSKVVADNAAGNPAAVLTAADGPGRLTIAAWCLDDECTDAKRDALAESVAAQVRPAR